MRVVPVALALILLLPSALAQSPIAPQVGLSLSSHDLKLDAGNETRIYGNVSNGGRLQGSASLRIVVPEGWDVSADQRTFPIAAGATQPIVLVLRAPAAAHGAATGRIEVTVTFAEDGTGAVANANDAIAVARVDPIPPPPPGTSVEEWALFATASALVIASVVVLETRRRRAIAAALAAEKAAWIDRELGIGIELDGPMIPWGLRRELLQRIVVRNDTDKPRVAHLGLRESAPGWTAAVSLPRLPLEPRERVAITLYLNPGDAVPGGESARFVVYARNAEAQEHEERLAIEIEAPPVRIPGPEASTSIALRDGSAVRPSLRR